MMSKRLIQLLLRGKGIVQRASDRHHFENNKEGAGRPWNLEVIPAVKLPPIIKSVQHLALNVDKVGNCVILAPH